VAEVFPTQISIQADIEIEVVVSSALIDEFNRREEDFMNLGVNREISIFPNLYNLIVLVDEAGERDSILTQCKGFYNPEDFALAAGEVPLVYLSRLIEDLPDHVMEALIAADPRVLETGDGDDTSVIDITDPVDSFGFTSSGT